MAKNRVHSICTVARNCMTVWEQLETLAGRLLNNVHEVVI